MPAKSVQAETTGGYVNDIDLHPLPGFFTSTSDSIVSGTKGAGDYLKAHPKGATLAYAPNVVVA